MQARATRNGQLVERRAREDAVGGYCGRDKVDVSKKRGHPNKVLKYSILEMHFLVRRDSQKNSLEHSPRRNFTRVCPHLSASETHVNT